MVGLDAAGKTTMLYIMFVSKVSSPLTCMTPYVETYEDNRTTLVSFDVGEPKMWPLWRHYFRGLSGLIWVVDSNDRERIGESREELFRILGEEGMDKISLLVFANKQDLPNALSVEEIVEKLELNSVPESILWNIQGTCATSGDGLYEGFDWLHSAMKGNPVPGNVVPTPRTRNIKAAKR
eukprot:CAMPEP_0201477596 /NCGR_PEP_ID=MMETSP0151_2-20130828/2594_1 /ASSEMBLY_ACC=CAM_ASM_000257 /TAXON_ID=200890 /ORGANISM="Paramoeba atlantica, Strain 621/1 / CCAP 1560/9" /LENGTH=179 /DNA_ID=CAMNT_0047858375 /DNA_START=145 /DNA_END=684 /DNA_ORIENTATION=+